MNEPTGLPTPPSDTPPTALKLVSKLKWLSWFVAACANFFPAMPFFQELLPPALPAGVVAMLGVGGLFLLLWSYKREKEFSELERRGAAVAIGLVVLLAIYTSLLAYCTVSPPQGCAGDRRQIGFYVNEWSLTEGAINKIRQLRADDPPIDIHTPAQLMNVFGVWGGEGRTDEIWTPISIVVAGGLLVFLFVASYALWSYCLGIVVQLASRA